MAITNGYCTLTQIKAAARMGTADTTDDSLLEMAIESASRLIDWDTDRVFYASGTAVTRYFVPNDHYTVDIDDAITISAVETDDDGTLTYGVTWDVSTDFVKEPLNNLSGGQAWPTTRLRAVQDRIFTRVGKEPTVKITGQWGFGTAVPTIITQACVIQAARIYKRLDSPLGVAGFGDLGAIRVGKTDPDVSMMLRPFKKYGVA